MAADTGTDVLRRFNRTWSQRVGVLDESFLGLGRPLAVSRLLFEVGVEGATVRELRERLDLDSGYLARLLRRLEDDRLVTVSPDPVDRRRRVVALTGEGRETWRSLDDRSEALARELVAPLTDRQRARFTEALATADLLVRAATVRLREVEPIDAAAVEATGHYFAELDSRLPGGFDPGDPSYAEPPAGAGVFVVATSDGVAVACGGVQGLGDGVGEIKRMWVASDWRGAGLGTRMLRHLEGACRGLGHHTVRLDTNATLTEAIAMYERAGYHRIERYNDNPYAEVFFEKSLS